MGCRAVMVQESLGVASGFQDGRTGAVAAGGFGAEDRQGTGLGAGAIFVVTPDVSVVASTAQLVKIGARRGSLRPFARAGVGYNLGWIDGDFGGGAALSAEAGLMFGRKRCGATLHAAGWYLTRIGAAPDEPFVGLQLGYSCAYHRSD